MARIRLDIEDMATRITVQTMLTTEGHAISPNAFDLCVTDSVPGAIAAAAHGPVIVLANAATIPDAVDAMRQGVYAYAFLPLQPGEIALLIARAVAAEIRPSSAAADTLDVVEARHIEATLRRCRHNQAQAARELGIGRNTLWRKLRKIKSRNAHDTSN